VLAVKSVASLVALLVEWKDETMGLMLVGMKEYPMADL
jgi:hypothetical protein